VEPRIKTLESRIDANVFNLLRGPWTTACLKCYEGQSIEFTPTTIGELLKNRYIEVECSNPRCMDQVLIFVSRHKLRFNLADLIQTLIS
jgi:hypothetical protein